MTRVPKSARRIGFDEVVDLLGIRAHLPRDPGGLSGGERQRVAIARALLTSPRLLLMDEPLSALDHASKQDILPYLERLHENLRIPVLYVTHSPDEIARLADHILMLEAGRLRAAGSAAEVLARLDLPLAQDSEASAIIDGRVSQHDQEYQLTWIDVPGGRIAIAHCSHPPGSRVRVRIHARDVSLALDEPGNSSILNILPARIEEIQELDQSQVLIKLITRGAPGAALLARITRHSRDKLGLRPNQILYAQVKAVALMG
jgi:molybdate transport system ATP-binding protein